jgi:hypothetical protein
MSEPPPGPYEIRFEHGSPRAEVRVFLDEVTKHVVPQRGCVAPPEPRMLPCCGEASPPGTFATVPPRSPGPFDWIAVRLDAEACERLRRVAGVAQLEPGGDPVEGAHVHLVASREQGEVVTEGHVARVIGPDHIVVELIHVDDEDLGAALPLLVVLARDDRESAWRSARWEPTYSAAPEDAVIEEVRAAVVLRRFAHLGRMRQEAEGSAGRFAAMMRAPEAERVRAQMQEVRAWHRETGRAWLIDGG